MKEFLSQKGITVSERDVSQDHSAAQEAYRVSGQTGVPVTVIDGQTVIGFDRPRLEQIIASARPAAKRPFGLRITDSSRTPQAGTAPVIGAWVDRVAPGSPAERAGLARGDIVTEVDARPIAGAADLEKALAAASPGGRLGIVFVRGNQRLKTEAQL